MLLGWWERQLRVLNITWSIELAIENSPLSEYSLNSNIKVFIIILLGSSILHEVA
jgi:hypothetical protein